MANPEEGQVEFSVNDKRFVLEITNRAERAIQKKLGRSMGKVISGLADGDTEDLLAIFVEGLKKHQPDFTEDQAIDLVRPMQLRDLVGELLQVTYPAKENPTKPSQEVETGSENSGRG